VPLDLRGRAEFEQAVWHKALEIPRGEVRPYGWIAAEIGRPKAVRAVGSALGRNPVPLIVPCHRVVRTDGTIGQYSLGGSSNKRRVLEAEGLDLPRLERLAARGVRLVGSDTTHIVCHPSCHHAKRITERHVVAFHALVDAQRAGYRACRDCRPVTLAA
jgi:O-6-methylguanine DNA methyltransferase